MNYREPDYRLPPATELPETWARAMELYHAFLDVYAPTPRPIVVMGRAYTGSEAYRAIDPQGYRDTLVTWATENGIILDFLEGEKPDIPA